MSRIGFEGFTLPEVMVTVLVIGIVAGLSGYAYQEHLVQQRRVEAVQSILDLKRQIEACMADGTALSTCRSQASAPNSSHYTYAVKEGSNDGGWLIVAKPLDGGAQSSDDALKLNALSKRHGPWPG